MNKIYNVLHNPFLHKEYKTIKDTGELYRTPLIKIVLEVIVLRKIVEKHA